MKIAMIPVFVLLLISYLNILHARRSNLGATYMGLKDYYVPHQMFIGTAVNPTYLQTDTQYKQIVSREYNIMTAGNAMKWAAIRPSEGKFDFSSGDIIIAYAKSQNKKVRGHTLLWESYNPKWLTSGGFTAPQLKSLLSNHISTVMTHYKTKFPGVVQYWDVVNEIINSGPGVWAPIGTPYDITSFAFKEAYKADPSTKLCINEYNMENNAAGTKTYTLVKQLVTSKIPIHCVGFQGHIRSNISIQTWMKSLKAYTDLGLEVQITEMDIPGASPSAYANALTACLNTNKCTAFVIWGVTDKYTWLGTSATPLLFDINYNAKPAYFAIQKVLNSCINTHIANCTRCKYIT